MGYAFGVQEVHLLHPDHQDVLAQERIAGSVARLGGPRLGGELGRDLDEPELVRAIIASMVEREAKLDVDRPKIARVIYNRLKSDTRLDIDATVGSTVPRVTAAAGLFRDDNGEAGDFDVHQAFVSYVVPAIHPMSGFPPTGARHHG